MKIPGRAFWFTKLALGLAVIAWLVSRTDLESLWSTLRSIEWLWLIPVLLLPHLGILLSSMKWHALLRARGAHASQGMLFRLYMIGTFFSSFLPSMVGGDVVRVYQLSRAGCDSSVVVASTFLERFVGLVALITLLPLAAMQPKVSQALPGLWQFIALAAVGVAILSVVLFTGRAASAGEVDESARGLVARLQRILRRSRQQVQSYRGHTGSLAYGYVLSLVFYLSAGVTVWCATRAVGGTPDLLVIVSVTPLVLMLGLIPISINGLGILEAGYTWLLMSLGMTLSEALAVALVLRFRSLLTAGLGGMLFLAYRGVVPQPVVATHHA